MIVKFINPKMYYPVPYIISNTGEKIEGMSILLGEDLTENQIKWLDTNGYFKINNELTHQQEINKQLKAELESWKTENFENVDQANKTIDELKKANEELVMRLYDSESSIYGSDIKIHDLKKQNAELVEALTRIAMRSDDDDPFESDQTIALKALSNTPPKN